MRHGRDERLVARDQGRRHEAQPRVLHPAVGEAGREDDQVVTIPEVGAEDLLGRDQHRLGVRELGGRRLDHAGLGVDAGARAERAEVDLAHRQRQKVGGDGLRHPEPVDAVGSGPGRVFRAHQRGQPRRHADRRLVGEALGRRVLAGHPAPRVDGLPLAEQEGMFLSVRLPRVEPLQPGGRGRGRVVDVHDARVGRDLDRERAAQMLDRIADAEGGLSPARLERDLPDVELVDVEPQLGSAGEVVDQQRGPPLERPRVEVHAQVEDEVLDAHLVGPREGVRVQDAWRFHAGRRRASGEQEQERR